MPRFTEQIESAVEALSANPSQPVDENEFIDASRLVYDGIRDIRKAVLMIRVSCMTLRENGVVWQVKISSSFYRSQKCDMSLLLQESPADFYTSGFWTIRFLNRRPCFLCEGTSHSTHTIVTAEQLDPSSKSPILFGSVQ